MAKSMNENGWTVRFRFRTIKKKRMKNGRTRGRYEGKYVYLRVTSPEHLVREIYLGSTRSSRSSTSETGGRNGEPQRELAGDVAGGRRGGQKGARPAGIALRLDGEPDDAAADRFSEELFGYQRTRKRTFQAKRKRSGS